MGTVPPFGAGGDAGQYVAGQIAGFAERVDVYPVGDLASHPQHPRIHRCHIDFGVGRVDRSRTPLGVMKSRL